MSLQRKEFWVDISFKTVLVLLATLWIFLAPSDGNKNGASPTAVHELKP